MRTRLGGSRVLVAALKLAQKNRAREINKRDLWAISCNMLAISNSWHLTKLSFFCHIKVVCIVLTSFFCLSLPLVSQNAFENCGGRVSIARKANRELDIELRPTPFCINLDLIQ